MTPKYIHGPVHGGMGDGALMELIAALRAVEDGELFGFLATEADLGDDLRAWAALTGHALLSSARVPDGVLHTFRRGRAPAEATRDEPGRPPPVGSRLFVYTNFDCNLACDYCCVRSSPTARARRFTLEDLRTVVDEARACGVKELFLTGGEPLLHPDAVALMRVASDALPTTVMTNGALVKGAMLERLQGLSRERLAFQVSLDSPTAELHDLHRGRGSWARASRGARALIDAGFRVRIAGTVRTDAEAVALDAHLEALGIPLEDRIVRRQALRGLAEDGVALVRSELHPDVTLTSDGVYYHPVGADDDDLRVVAGRVPVAEAIAAVKRAAEADRAFDERLASVFVCA